MLAEKGAQKASSCSGAMVVNAAGKEGSGVLGGRQRGQSTRPGSAGSRASLGLVGLGSGSEVRGCGFQQGSVLSGNTSNAGMDSGQEEQSSVKLAQRFTAAGM